MVRHEQRDVTVCIAELANFQLGFVGDGRQVTLIERDTTDVHVNGFRTNRVAIGRPLAATDNRHRLLADNLLVRRPDDFRRGITIRYQISNRMWHRLPIHAVIHHARQEHEVLVDDDLVDAHIFHQIGDRIVKRLRMDGCLGSPGKNEPLPHSGRQRDALGKFLAGGKGLEWIHQRYQPGPDRSLISGLGWMMLVRIKSRLADSPTVSILALRSENSEIDI